MAKKRREKDAADIKLRQPNRLAPTEKTLLQIAREQDLFRQADEKQRRNTKGQTGLSRRAEQALETVLWSVSLSMLHFTLDVLVQHQYAVDIAWWEVARQCAQSFLGM